MAALLTAGEQDRVQLDHALGAMDWKQVGQVAGRLRATLTKWGPEMLEQRRTETVRDHDALSTSYGYVVGDHQPSQRADEALELLILA